MDWSNIVAAGIGSVPSSIAAFYAAKSKRYSKVAAHTGARNETKLQDLSNGKMDEKIKRATRQVLDERRKIIPQERRELDRLIKKAVREVLDERPDLVTEANIFTTMDRLLSQHLKEDN